MFSLFVKLYKLKVLQRIFIASQDEILKSLVKDFVLSYRVSLLVCTVR